MLRPRRTTHSRLPTVLALAALGVVRTAAPLAGQNGAAADSLAEARRLARADSARAALVQPPGDHDGLTGADVVRFPFQVIGGTLALGAAGVFLVYGTLDKIGVVDGIADVRSSLRDVGVETGYRTIGSRSAAALQLRFEGASPFYAEAAYSLRRYQHYEAGIEFGDEDRGLRARGQLRKMREPHFWGIGPSTLRADRSDYAHDRILAGGSAWTSFGPLTVSALGDWEEHDTGPGFDATYADAVDTFTGVFGLDERTRWVRGGLGVDLDLVRVSSAGTSYRPRGVQLLGGWSHWEGLEDAPVESAFQKVFADVRAHVPVLDRHALAVRARVDDVLAERGGGIPFVHLPELGDDDGLRGYRSTRFRDSAVAFVQAEWRWQVWWHPGDPNLHVEGFVFSDQGAVADSFGALSWDQVRWTPGFGLRWVDRGVGQLETYLAFNGEGTRLDLAFTPTF